MTVYESGNNVRHLKPCIFEKIFQNANIISISERCTSNNTAVTWFLAGNDQSIKLVPRLAPDSSGVVARGNETKSSNLNSKRNKVFFTTVAHFTIPFLQLTGYAVFNRTDRAAFRCGRSCPWRWTRRDRGPTKCGLGATAFDRYVLRSILLSRRHENRCWS